MGTALRDGYRDKAFLMTKIDGRSAVPGHPFLDGKWAPGQNALTVAVGKTMSKDVDAGWETLRKRDTGEG